MGVGEGEPAVTRGLGGSGFGTRRDSAPVRVHLAKVQVPLTTVIVAWVLRRLWAALPFVLRRPLLLAAVGVVVLAGRVTAHHGPLPVVLALAVLAVALAAWWRLRPESFTRWVVWRLRGAWRAATVYRYSWQPAIVTAGLHLTRDGVEHLPRMLSVRTSGRVDLVRVRMLPGQTTLDYADAADRLAQTFGVLECRVRSVPRRPHDLVLWFLTGDPLVDDVPPVDPGETTDPARLAVGRAEDGASYRLKLLGTHLLIVGATGSGKGSVLWSIIAALCPGVRAGLVELWALDPKGGMELAFGGPLFHRFVYGDGGDGGSGSGYELDFARVLEDAVSVMRRRQAALRGRTRLHAPTVAEPLVVVVVDEIASLTAYVTDREAKQRIAAALSLLLSQGRAVGVLVVGAVQDPRKDVIALRDLFPTRVALRLVSSDEVDMVLGRGARARGARCDQIRESLPGVGYVVVDSIPEPVRVRFTHITDEDVAALVARYAPGASTRTATSPTGALRAPPADSRLRVVDHDADPEPEPETKTVSVVRPLASAGPGRGPRAPRAPRSPRASSRSGSGGGDAA